MRPMPSVSFLFFSFPLISYQKNKKLSKKKKKPSLYNVPSLYQSATLVSKGLSFLSEFLFSKVFVLHFSALIEICFC